MQIAAQFWNCPKFSAQYVFRFFQQCEKTFPALSEVFYAFIYISAFPSMI